MTFTNFIGNVIETITLSNGANANELNANPVIDNHQFNSGDPNITEDTYTVTFIGTDQAGNIGETLINNYTYDITPPTAQLSFSQLFASVIRLLLSSLTSLRICLPRLRSQLMP